MLPVSIAEYSTNGVYKYFSGFSGAGEVYKYFSGGAYKYFSGVGEVYKYFSDGVYKYFSGAEKCINTSPTVYINTSPAVSPEKYLYTSPGAGEVYINTSPAFFGAGEESGNCRSIYI